MSVSAKPRILISYFFRSDSIPLGGSCERALRELGWEVATFDSQAEHPLEQYAGKYLNRLMRQVSGGRWTLSPNRRIANDRYREQRLEEAVRAFRPDVLLVVRGNGYPADFLASLKQRHGIKSLLGWWVKNPREGQELLQDAKSYDHYYCIHRYGYGPDDGVVRLPAGAVDALLYPPAARRDEGSLDKGIVLVGGYSPRREQFLKPLNGLPLTLYGPGWRKRPRTFDPFWKQAWAGRGVWGLPLVDLYHRSRIVLNVTSWDPARMTGENLRLFDVPATGAFLLTDESDEVREYYRVGEEVETFSSPDELADKARYYLANPDVRERIARNGYQRCLTLPTYVDRMREMLRAAGLQQAGSRD